jgi:hypothetical protein
MEWKQAQKFKPTSGGGDGGRGEEQTNGREEKKHSISPSSSSYTTAVGAGASASASAASSSTSLPKKKMKPKKRSGGSSGVGGLASSMFGRLRNSGAATTTTSTAATKTKKQIRGGSEDGSDGDRDTGSEDGGGVFVSALADDDLVDAANMLQKASESSHTKPFLSSPPSSSSYHQNQDQDQDQVQGFSVEDGRDLEGAWTKILFFLQHQPGVREQSLLLLQLSSFDGFFFHPMFLFAVDLFPPPPPRYITSSHVSSLHDFLFLL